MENELDQYREQGHAEHVYEKIKIFRELFVLLQSQKPDKQYQDAYEEAAQTASGFVAVKNRSSWNPDDFAATMNERYPKISDTFIEALRRCIENHDPVVNIPTEPLWE